MGTPNPDLGVVNCYIDFSSTNNASLFNQVELHEILSKDVEDFFKKYRIRYHMIEGFGGRGAGVDHLRDLILAAWKNREIIKIIVTILVTFCKGLYKIIKFLATLPDRYKPRVVISLNIRNESEYRKENLHYLKLYIRSSLLNLFNFSNELIDKLINTYPSLAFDLTLSVDSVPLNYSASYSINQEFRNKFNLYRFRHLIKSITVKRHHSYKYFFSRFLLIIRNQSRRLPEDPTKGKIFHKRYFLILSTKVLADYFLNSL